jgi:hypothetical protein
MNTEAIQEQKIFTKKTSKIVYFHNKTVREEKELGFHTHITLFTKIVFSDSVATEAEINKYYVTMLENILLIKSSSIQNNHVLNNLLMQWLRESIKENHEQLARK